MNSFFKPLFSSSNQEYHYDLPFDTVKTKIEEVFDDSTKFLSFTDMQARFTSRDAFEIETISSAITHGVKYRSTLYGSLIKNGESKTIILTKTKAANSFKFIFWIALVICFIYLLKGLVYQASNFIIYGLMIGTIGPFLSIKIAGINTASVEDRYQMYIDKKLKSVKTH